MTYQKVVSIFLIFLRLLEVYSADNLNLVPRQIVNESGNGKRFKSPHGKQDQFHLLDAYDDSIIVGARNAVYNLSKHSLEPKYTIHWKSSGQIVEECHMKGRLESECHNFIRVVTQLKNGRTLVCGTHAFSPYCREYEFSLSEDRFIDKLEFSGRAIAPFDPKDNSTFVYDKNSNDLYSGTVSDFGRNDPLIYRKKLPNGESLRTQKDDLKVMDSPNFVGSFIYKEHVYFWYRELAAETLDNNKEEQVYARVGRVCRNDRGGPSPVQDRYTTFLKARLNCSLPADIPFYFNEIQSLSEPVPTPDGDAVVYAVFQTSRSPILMSAVCAFRMSAVISNFDHGRFKAQRTPQSLWGPLQKFYPNPAERPGRCVADSRKITDVSFVLKNPLIYELVDSVHRAPMLVEGPSRAELTKIAVLPQVKSVRGQPHDIVYVGRADGQILKIVESSPGAINQTSIVVERIRVFDDSTMAVRDIKTIESTDELLVTSYTEVVKIPLFHCSQQTSCAACVGLRDPHCAWDVDNRLCVNMRDWSKGSYVQNVLTGVSEQCPGGTLFMESSYLINDDQQVVPSNLENSVSEASQASGTIAAAVILTAVLASVIGFVVGYRVSNYRIMNDKHLAHSSGSSSGGSDYDSYGRARLTRHDSMKTTDHIYAAAPPSKAMDAVSLVLNQSIHGHVVPVPVMTSISNGNSGLTTPRHDRNLLLNGAVSNMNGSSQLANLTLPRDYRVKKVYL